jgi:hypothetical protein
LSNHFSPLTIEDIVRIKTLMPESVYFGYVEGSTLEVNFDGQGSSKEAQKADIYRLPNVDDSELPRVLFFEFTDGELRPKVNRRKGYSSLVSD